MSTMILERAPLTRDPRGRKPCLTYAQALWAVERLKDPEHSKLLIAMHLGCSRETINRIYNMTPAEIAFVYDRGITINGSTQG